MAGKSVIIILMSEEKQRHHHHHHTYQRSLLLLFIGGACVVVQFFASFVLVLSLIKLNILQVWQLLLVIFILVLIFAYNVYEIFFRRKAKLFGIIASCVIALLISGGCFFAYNYIEQANDFLASITGIQEETVVYDVYVRKNGEITSYNQLKDKEIGFMYDNPNLNDLKNKIAEELGNLNAVGYDVVGNLISDAYEGKISAFAISESYIEFLEDSDFKIEDDFTVIHEVKFTIPGRSDLRTPVDVVKEPFIVYISGSDSRKPGYVVSRSDVNILAVVNPSKGKILLVNIPRDYYVQLHGTTGLKDKLTHAGLYGIDMSKSTIEDLLGIQINYTVRVGFQGVQKFVDAIDGIDIDSPIAMKLTTGDQSEATGDHRQYCYYKKGMNHLDGICALRYARERKKFADGDLDRGKHQQQVLTAIIEKITNLHYVTRFSQILEAAKGTFQTSFNESEISDFIRWQLAELKHWQVESIQIGNNKHILTPTYTIRNENLWVYLPDEASENAAKQKIAEYLTK